MTIRADLSVDGKRYFPRLKVSKSGETEKMDMQISGTDKIITIKSLSAKEKSVQIFVTPEKDAVIPPDSAILEVSHKRLIWVVWLGTILIAAGFLISMRRVLKQI